MVPLGVTEIENLNLTVQISSCDIKTTEYNTTVSVKQEE